jgi:MFS family permease
MLAQDAGNAHEDWTRLGLAGKAALALAATNITLALFAISSGLPAIQRAFAGSPNSTLMIQIMAGMVAPVFALASPVAGRLVARYGVREVWLVSIGVAILAGLAPAACTELWQMLPFRLLIGCAAAGAFTAGMAGVAQLPERERHVLFGLVGFFGGVMAIVGFAAVGYLAARGWQYAFAIHLLMLPAALLGLALPRHREATAAGAAQGAGAAGARVPAYLLFAAVVVGWAMVSTSIFAPVLLGSLGVDDPRRVGSLLAIMSLCSLAGSGSYGFVHRLLGTGGMLLYSMAAMVGGALVVALAGSVFQAVAGISLMGLGIAVFGAAVYPAAIEAVAAKGGGHAAAAGVISLTIYLPQIAFPFIGTAIAAAYGPAMVYLLLAGLVGVGLVVTALPVLGARRVARAA